MLLPLTRVRGKQWRERRPTADEAPCKTLKEIAALRHLERWHHVVTIGRIGISRKAVPGPASHGAGVRAEPRRACASELLIQYPSCYDLIRRL
jgi:hypothetical protein